MSDPSRSRRRWFQFSLGTLLAFVLLGSLGMGWFAVRMQRAWRQREAVEAIEKLGGLCSYDFQVLGKQPPGPTWLRRVLGECFFASVVEIHVFHPLARSVTDAFLDHIEDLPHLKVLDLQDTNVTDGGLERLKELARLQRLILDDTQTTNAGLWQLKGLAQLRLLSLGRTRVSDQGLGELKGLMQLQFLYLDQTAITDAGLESLQRLTNLRVLSLLDTHVTEKGVKTLQQALPNCKIITGTLEAP